MMLSLSVQRSLRLWYLQMLPRLKLFEHLTTTQLRLRYLLLSHLDLDLTLPLTQQSSIS